MIVLHVTPYFAPAWAYGDVPHDVAALARAQRDAGHQVVVLTTDAMAPHERLPAGETLVEGVRVIRARNISGVLRLWLGFSTPVGLRAHARTLFRSQPVDVVHLHELRTIENVLVAVEAPAGVPLVLSTHGTLRFGQRHSWATRAWDASFGSRLLARVDQLAVRSESEAAELAAMHSERGRALGRDAISVVPDGVNLSAVSHLPEQATIAVSMDAVYARARQRRPACTTRD